MSNLFSYLAPDRLPDPIFLIDNRYYIVSAITLLIIGIYWIIAEAKNIECEIKTVAAQSAALVTGVYVALVCLLILGKKINKDLIYFPSELFFAALVMGLVNAYSGFRNVRKEFSALF